MNKQSKTFPLTWFQIHYHWVTDLASQPTVCKALMEERDLGSGAAHKQILIIIIINIRYYSKTISPICEIKTQW